MHASRILMHSGELKMPLIDGEGVVEVTYYNSLLMLNNHYAQIALRNYHYSNHEHFVKLLL